MRFIQRPTENTPETPEWKETSTTGVYRTGLESRALTKPLAKGQITHTFTGKNIWM